MAALTAFLHRGEVLELLDDMLELQPTVFISVPRLYNRVYDRVMAAIREGNPMARRLFETAYASKKAALDKGDKSGGAMAPLWNRLVFSKIAARLGGEGCEPDEACPSCMCWHTRPKRLLWTRGTRAGEHWPLCGTWSSPTLLRALEVRLLVPILSA